MNALVPTKWTGEVEESFRILVADDRNTARDIARKLREQCNFVVTRNAVIGKAHRLKLIIGAGARRNAPYYPTSAIHKTKRTSTTKQSRINNKIRIQLRRAEKMGVPFDWESSFIDEFGLKPVKFIETTGCRYPLHARDEDNGLLCCNDPIALPGTLSSRVKAAAPLYCVGHALLATNPRVDP